MLVPARLRHGRSWSDTCILDISSTGLMIHTGRPIARGTKVEIRRGDHVILARVVWRDGGRAGLHAAQRVPVEEIVSLGHLPALELTAAPAERRKNPRCEGRRRGRSVEFVVGVLIAVSLAGLGLSMVEAAFAPSLTAISAALGD